MTHNDNSTDVYSDNAVSQKKKKQKKSSSCDSPQSNCAPNQNNHEFVEQIVGKNKIDSNECCPGLVSGINRLEKFISKNYREGD